MKPSSPFFSIVIPTLNEEKYLPLLLDSLSQQSFMGSFEVIVVDGHSDDETKKVAESYKNRLDLTVITLQERHVSVQRNMGGTKGKGKWIIFMDADDTLPPHFLDGVKYQIEKNTQVEVFTVWLETKNYSPKVRPVIDLFNIWLELYSKLKPSAPGAMIGVRKNVFSTNHFDEEVKISEDFAFITAVVDKGHTFAVFREPRYTTSLRRFEKDKLTHLYRLSQVFISELKGDRHNTELEKYYPMRGGRYYESTQPPKRSVLKFKKLLKSFEVLWR